MKRCPECGSGAERTNIGEEVFADIMGFGAGLVGSVFGPAAARNAQKQVTENICEYKRYKCTNPKCNHEWSEKNYA